MSRYGLTVDTYKAMLLKQENKCLLCSREFTDIGDTEPHIDHCHTTGIVRGILCHGCNTALGKLGDTEEAILKVLEYLQKGS